MCHLCACFGWLLDFVQRLLTFVLALALCCSICIGFTMAIVAGIAYGYNYMLAEFLTLSRSDVRVYIRRGQYYDKQDLGIGATFRRSGEGGDLNTGSDLRRTGGGGDMNTDSDLKRSGEGEDLFSSNASDYQDMAQGDSEKSLSDSWRKTQGSHKYKYGHKLIQHPGEFTTEHVYDKNLEDVFYMAKAPPPGYSPSVMRMFPGIPSHVTRTPGIPNHVSRTPGRLNHVTRNSETPNQVTRNSETPNQVTQNSETPNRVTRTPDRNLNMRNRDPIEHLPIIPKFSEFSNSAGQADPDKSMYDHKPKETRTNTKKIDPALRWLNYPADDVDEEKVVYKPV